MARVKQPRPNSDVRLRNWPPGRVSQLKLFLGHLQQAVGISLAAQVEQSAKRFFSEFVPKIVPQDIESEIALREIRVRFTPPRGLKNLLFYEFQISGTEGFFNLDQFTSPNPHFVFTGLEDGTTYFIRMRVVTKDGDVGPWSTAVELATPLAQSYGLYDSTEFSTRVQKPSFYTWHVVYQRPYTAIGGMAYYAIDYDITVARDWTSEANIEWSDVELKWMDRIGEATNDSQRGQAFNVTTYSSNQLLSPSPFYIFKVTPRDYNTPLVIPGTWQNARRGTFVQKFHEIEQGEHVFRLMAKVYPDHQDAVFKSDFYPLGTTKMKYGSDAIIKLKNFNIFEVLVDDELTGDDQ